MWGVGGENICGACVTGFYRSSMSSRSSLRFRGDDVLLRLGRDEDGVNVDEDRLVPCPSAIHHVVALDVAVAHHVVDEEEHHGLAQVALLLVGERVGLWVRAQTLHHLPEVPLRLAVAFDAHEAVALRVDVPADASVNGLILLGLLLLRDFDDAALGGEQGPLASFARGEGLGVGEVLAADAVLGGGGHWGGGSDVNCSISVYQRPC